MKNRPTYDHVNSRPTARPQQDRDQLYRHDDLRHCCQHGSRCGHAEQCAPLVRSIIAPAFASASISVASLHFGLTRVIEANPRQMLRTMSLVSVCR